MANVMVEEDFGSTAAIPTEVSLLRKPKLPTRKSVEFAIGQSSPKRYRSTAWSAKQALGGMFTGSQFGLIRRRFICDCH